MAWLAETKWVVLGAREHERAIASACSPRGRAAGEQLQGDDRQHDKQSELRHRPRHGRRMKMPIEVVATRWQRARGRSHSATEPMHRDMQQYAGP